MSLMVRLLTALLASSLVWLGFTPPSILRIWIYGLWALGVIYMGLILAAEWEVTDETS